MPSSRKTLPDTKPRRLESSLAGVGAIQVRAAESAGTSLHDSGRSLNEMKLSI